MVTPNFRPEVRHKCDKTESQNIKTHIPLSILGPMSGIEPLTYGLRNG